MHIDTQMSCSGTVRTVKIFVSALESFVVCTSSFSGECASGNRDGVWINRRERDGNEKQCVNKISVMLL